MSIRYNDQDVRRVSEQAARIPIIAVTPDSHKLITGSPTYRRRWLDWAMFHVEPEYIESWQNYHKALRCRNNLLKQNQEAQLTPWERAMRLMADLINIQRQAFLNELSRELVWAGQRLNIPLPKLEYHCGWQEGVALDQHLEECRKEDLERGNTRYGLHRCDLLITENGKQIGHYYSRGQVKLFITALSLAQVNVFKRRTNRQPILLVDDLSAELDGDSQSRIIQTIIEHGGQVFITTTKEAITVDLAQQKVFHVEHGRFTT